MYKVSKGLSTTIITDWFKPRDEQHNLEHNAGFTIPVIMTAYHASLHKLIFFLHEISHTQNRFRCMSVQVENCASKIADVQVPNKNILTYKKFAKLLWEKLP